MHSRIHIYNLHEPCLPSRMAATDAEADESKVDEVQASIGRGGPWATGRYMPRNYVHMCVYAYVGLHVYFYANVCIYSREEWLVFLFYLILAIYLDHCLMSQKSQNSAPAMNRANETFRVRMCHVHILYAV